VGRSTEVSLETVEPIPDDRLLESLPGVSKVERVADNRFHIILQEHGQIDTVVDSAIRAVLAQGLHIRGIHPNRQSLESLYLSYTDGEGRP